jgi:chromosome segregation ATPase
MSEEILALVEAGKKSEARVALRRALATHTRSELLKQLHPDKATARNTHNATEAFRLAREEAPRQHVQSRHAFAPCHNHKHSQGEHSDTNEEEEEEGMRSLNEIKGEVEDLRERLRSLNAFDASTNTMTPSECASKRQRLRQRVQHLVRCIDALESEQDDAPSGSGGFFSPR